MTSDNLLIDVNNKGVYMSKLILSLDGGGIRGAATTQFLSRVEAKLKADHNKSIRDCVDFYAGTSTGSMIALALATTNMTMDEVNNLYNYENAQIIFDDNKGWFEVDGINAPKFESKGKTKTLKENLKGAKIGDVPDNKHILAVTYAIEERKPMVIKSTKENNKELLSYQVADASSAAPTFFPTRNLENPTDPEDEYWLIDGGVVANNPTMCAISEARRAWSDEPFNELRVLSVGTGYMTRKINGPKSTKWGAAQWITKGKLMEIVTDERIVAYQAMSIVEPGKYIRVNAKLSAQPGLSYPPDDSMDDVSKKNIKRLKLLGDFWFEQYGQSTVELLVDSYEGPSLDRIDSKSGKPIQQN
jgi:hypothetical protein